MHPDLKYDALNAKDSLDPFPESPMPYQVKKRSSVCLHAALVEVYEHTGLTRSVPLGQLGAALLHFPAEQEFSLLMYTPISKKPEFEVEVVPSFAFTVLPNLFITFCDTFAKKYWSMKFRCQDDLTAFGRMMAVIKDHELNTSYREQGPRRATAQVLSLGDESAPEVQVGDQVKVKAVLYAASETYPAHPLGHKIATEPKKFVVGEQSTAIPALEEAVVGMKKKSSKFLVLPSQLAANASHVWGPHVPAGVTLLAELTVSSIRPAHEVAARRRKKEDGVPVDPEPEVEAEEGEEAGEPHPSPDRTHGPLEGGTLVLPVFEDPAHYPPEGVPQKTNSNTNSTSTTTSTTTTTTTTEEAVKPQPETKKKKKKATRETHERKEGERAVEPEPEFTYEDPLPDDTTDTTGERDELALLFNGLGLMEYLPVFRKEGISLHDLSLLEPEDVETLIPAIGPRRRLMFAARELDAQKHAPKHRPALFPVKAKGSREEDDILSTHGSLALSLDTDLVEPKQLDEAYEKGKRDIADQARTRIEEWKAAAMHRLHDIQGEVDMEVERAQADEHIMDSAKSTVRALKEQLGKHQLRTKEVEDQNQHTLEQGRALVAKLEVELEKLRSEIQTVKDRSQQFVAQVREGRDKLQSHSLKQVKSCMESLFTSLGTSVKPNELYDGAQVCEMVKSAIRTVTADYTRLNQP